MQDYYNTEQEKNQEVLENIEVLEDKSASGRERPWRDKKEYNMKLAEVYKYVDMDKSDRLADCGTVLSFGLSSDGGLKLHHANFCRVRLCPMCQWRRSLKVHAQMSKIFEQLDDDYAVICLNLTMRNCAKDELSSSLDLLADDFTRLMKYKPVKECVFGYYRATEITHNLDINDVYYDTFHPHLHCLLIVRKTYFTSRSYIPHEKWIALWRKALKTNYDPGVFVKKLYLKQGQDITQALCEVTKYTVKETDYITSDMNMNVETVSVLDKALDKRRFYSLGGILKELHKKLNLVDIEGDTDIDLVHMDEDDMTEEYKSMIRFVWDSGYKQYIKS